MSGRSVLVLVELVATSIWVGGLVAIMVVARIIRRQLEPAQQVAFFRALGRRWGMVGGGALAIALAAGAGLLADRGWDGTATAAALVAGGLVLTTLAGVAQAREMTRLRARAATGADDATIGARVRRGASRAMALRGAIAALTLALLALAATLAS